MVLTLDVVVLHQVFFPAKFGGNMLKRFHCFFVVLLAVIPSLFSAGCLAATTPNLRVFRAGLDGQLKNAGSEQQSSTILTPACLGTGPYYATTTTLSAAPFGGDETSTLTLTAVVTASTGNPTSYVDFALDSNTDLGKALLVPGNGTSSTAVFQVTGLPAGTHQIAAFYSGDTGSTLCSGGFTGSSTPPITVTVVAPALTTMLSASSLTIARGATGTTTVTLSPVGGYTGSATFLCGSLPADMTCTFSPSAVTLPGNDAAQTTTLTIGTGMKAELRPASHLGGLETASISLCMLLPVGLFSRRRISAKHLAAMLACLVFLGGLLFALQGCGGSGPDNRVSAGTYTVTVLTVLGSSTITTLNLQVTVQ